MNTKGKVYTVVFTFVIAFVFIFLLALVDNLLADRISRNEELSMVRALLDAMDIPFANDGDALRVFQNELRAETKDGVAFFVSERSGSPVYALVHRGDGLWGTITFAIAVDQDMSRIIGIDIISQNETPGLGGRIDEPWFKDQFRNEALSKTGGISVQAAGPGNTDHADGAIDAITGASITSKQLGILVNDSLAVLRRVTGGTP